MSEREPSTLTTDRVFLRPQQVAKMLGMSRTFVYDAIERGELRAERIGTKSIFVRPADVETWIAEQSVPVQGREESA